MQATANDFAPLDHGPGAAGASSERARYREKVSGFSDCRDEVVAQGSHFLEKKQYLTILHQ